jgi:hypothetical protein
MGNSGITEIPLKNEIWIAAENLVSAMPLEREQALDFLRDKGIFISSPLAAYLLATRTIDEDLEVRYHSIQILGELLDFEDSSGMGLTDLALKHVHGFFAQIGKDQMIRLLEVRESYLAAENALLNIFKIFSYAGDILSGIVNDRKIPASIRQVAIFLGGEAGFLELVPVFQNLIQRIEKSRERVGRDLAEKLLKEEDVIYSSAVVALGKLISGHKPEG